MVKMKDKNCAHALERERERERERKRECNQGNSILTPIRDSFVEECDQRK
jgi:hypothetical protein